MSYYRHLNDYPLSYLNMYMHKPLWSVICYCESVRRILHLHTLCMALLWLPDLLRVLFEEEWCNLESPAKRMQLLKNNTYTCILCILKVLYLLSQCNLSKERNPNLNLGLIYIFFKFSGVYIHVYICISSN